MECIITMSLIVFVSVVAYTATVISTNISLDSLSNLDMYSKIEMFDNAFNKTFNELGKSNEDESKYHFIETFDSYLKENLKPKYFILLKSLENNEIENESLTKYEYPAHETYLSFSFDYKYYNEKYVLKLNVHIRTGTYYYTMEGTKTNKRKATYSNEKKY